MLKSVDGDMPPQRPSPPAQPAAVVQDGDSLWTIAAAQVTAQNPDLPGSDLSAATASEWLSIEQLNPQIPAANKGSYDRIYPGQQINLPKAASPSPSATQAAGAQAAAKAAGIVAQAQQAEQTSGDPKEALTALSDKFVQADITWDVEQRVLADPYVQGLEKRVVAEAQKRSAKNPGSADGLTYLSNMASAAPPEVAARMVNQASGFIANQIKLGPKNADDLKTFYRDLSNLVSAVQGSTDADPITKQIAIEAAAQFKLTDAARQNYDQATKQPFSRGPTPSLPPAPPPFHYDSSAIQDVIGNGADPTLFLEVANQYKNGPDIQKDVLTGTKQFLTKFANDVNAANNAVGQLNYLGSQFSFFLDQNDPASVQKYQQYISDYFARNPDQAKKMESTQATVDADSRSVINLMRAYAAYPGLTKSHPADWAPLEGDFHKFFDDDSTMGLVSESPEALQRLIALEGYGTTYSSQPGFLEKFAQKYTTVGRQITGSAAAGRGGFARIFISVFKYHMTQAQLAITAGKPDKADIELNKLKDRAGILGLSRNATDAQNFKNTVDLARAAAQRKLDYQVAIGTPKEAEAESDFNDALKAYKSAPKTQLSLYADKTLGLGGLVRGLAAPVSAVYLTFVLADPSIPGWQKIALGAQFGASAAQQATLAYMMRWGNWGVRMNASTALGLFATGNATVDGTAVTRSAIGASAVDTIGDRVAFLGVLGSGANAYRSYQEGDPVGVGLNAASGVGNLSAALGALAGTGTDLPLGLTVGPRVALGLTGVGAVVSVASAVGLAGWSIHRNQEHDRQLAHRYENDETRNFLKQFGIHDEIAKELIKENDKGVSTGPMLQSLAASAGLNLSDAADRQKFIDYLNHRTPAQVRTMVTDWRNATNGTTNGTLPATDPTDVATSMESPDGRTVSTTGQPGGLFATYVAEPDGTIARIAGGKSTIVDPDKDSYAKQLKGAPANTKLFVYAPAHPQSMRALLDQFQMSGLPLPPDLQAAANPPAKA